MVRKRIVAGALVAALATTATTNAQTEPGTACTTDAMIVFDSSGSMMERDYNRVPTTRILDARMAMKQSLPMIAPFRRIGLIVYGPGPRDPCSNIDLRLLPEPDAAPRIVSELDRTSPAGRTPLTPAVERAANVLDYSKRPATIVLVTDGRENCGGEPCRLAEQLASNGADITIHVIGFRLHDNSLYWKGQRGTGTDDGRIAAGCLADRTGGRYYSPQTIEELAAAMRETLSCPQIGRLHTRPTPLQG